MNFLVVEDDFHLQKTYERFLHGRGHQAFLAASPKQAIALLKNRPYIDGVICDYQLEGGTGAEVYLWVSHHKPELLERFALVTATRGVDASFPSAHHFQKPCDLSGVIETLEVVA